MRFTVLTPTYNRAHTLGRVYGSLCAQTFHDFEWVIVDDGSTDRTRELVAPWKPFFAIRYFWKPNGGKHTAVNLGVSLAEGEFILIFDSDDRCVPDALERFDHHWRQIPHPSRFACLVAACSTPEGRPLSEPYPSEYVDAHSLEETLRYGAGGERWGIVRTDVLRQFPYPEGERYAIEALVWNRIARKYAIRFLNESLRIYYPTSGGIADTGMELLASSPRATLTYYGELFLSPIPLRLRLKAGANFCRFAVLAAGSKLSSVWRRLSGSSQIL
jgi:glycosyltransferase involved in cell wall biosynthesis